jgi:hypothetical protein
MPPMSFLMTGQGGVFMLAGPCPVTGGPHHGSPGRGAYAVADITTRDRFAAIRVAVWRCQPCGTLIAGIGSTEPPVDGEPGTGVHTQEFTWLEETGNG